MNKIPVLVVLGPTAVGKSDLAVKIAKEINGEIISADSRQVYKGMDIGTGKITQTEMQGVKHYLLDVVDPKEKFTVVDFKVMAENAINEIHQKGKVPIVCGGTGFYIETLIDNISLPNVGANEELRAELENKSCDELFNILNEIDQERAQSIDKNNKRKLIRAIEIVKEIGKVPILKHNNSKYDALFIGLILPSDELKTRIDKRLEDRINNGMIDEVVNLNKNGLSFERMDELGLEYRYIAKYLRNKMSKEEMISKLKTEIWHYAKRQMTWFKRDKRIKWFWSGEFNNIFLLIKRHLNI